MKLFYTAIVVSLLFFSACGPTLKVHADFDKSVDIFDYRYYNWPTAEAIEAKGLNPLYYNELNDKRIKEAVNKQLQQRGYILKNQPRQIEMHYHINIDDKTMAIKEPDNTYGQFWFKRNLTTYPYQEGTLIIDLMDAKTKVLVWRGWATAVIEFADKEDPATAIERAVNGIFKKFPYNFH